MITADDAPIDVLISLQPVNIVQAAADLLWSPVLRKFPDLRVALSEGGIGWIPYFHERVDWIYTRHHAVDRPGLRRQAPERGVPRADRHLLHRRPRRPRAAPPRRRRHDLLGERLPALRLDVADVARVRDDASFEAAGVPDDEIDTITHENAMRHFRFDPFATALPRGVHGGCAAGRRGRRRHRAAQRRQDARR